MTDPRFDRLWRSADISGGSVCFKGRGVLIEVLIGMFIAGDSLAFLAKEYDLDLEDFHQAMRLICFARGTNLDTQEGRRRVDRVIPLTPPRVAALPAPATETEK